MEGSTSMAVKVKQNVQYFIRLLMDTWSFLTVLVHIESAYWCAYRNCSLCSHLDLVLYCFQ